MALVPDIRLLDGFHFRCLPGCGLCCYTAPSVAPSERPRLIQLDPSAPFEEGRYGWANIASRPGGGACHFLLDNRCRCHDIRPATCAEFPLTAHASQRVQVSLVLTCPGVDLNPLRTWGSTTPLSHIDQSLAAELNAVTLELYRAEATGQLRQAAARRIQIEHRLRRRGDWQSEDDLRHLLRSRVGRLIPTELEGDELVGPEEAIETLPMFFDQTRGRVVWRAHPGGVEFLALRELGGTADPFEVLDPPVRSPSLAADGRELLEGYLRYLLDRDATISAAYLQLIDGESGSPEQVVAQDLERIAAQVIMMATLRRALNSSRRGELAAGDIENGIRATDMDILDRPTVGLRF